MKKTTLTILLGIILSHVYAQSNRSAFLKDSLENYINTGMKEWEIPGVAICIIKNDKVVYAKGFGITKVGGKNAIDTNTLFMIGSNSKAFTATAMAILDQQNKLSLDDTVTKWIPTFRLKNQLAGKQAIVKDILCHRIGFETFQGDFTYWKSDLSSDQIIERMAHITPVYPFRTTWGYTNAGYVVAGKIIQKASGLSWSDFVKSNIFSPLGMTRTITSYQQLVKSDNIAMAHSLVDEHIVKVPFGNIDNLAPAGSISSSVNDMSKWVTMLLNHGVYDGEEHIPANAIANTWYPQIVMGQGRPYFNTGHFSLYGLGWELQEYAGKKIVSHTGGVTGFVTSVTLIPEEKIGIVILTNTDANLLFEGLKWEIVDAYLQLPYRNYSHFFHDEWSKENKRTEEADQKLKDSVAMQLKTSIPLKSFTGKYHNEVYGDMSVVLDGNQLEMKFSHHPHLKVPLRYIGNDRFYVVFSDPDFSKAVFPFHIKNGKVKSVTVKVSDFVEMTPYEFTKTN